MAEQRKLISVIFADMVGSTALASERDPEFVRRVMSRYFERMREIAEAHGGTVEKFAGDSVLVVFGVPRVHDDDAERAVRTALAMKEAVHELSATLPFELTARFAVNTGEAMTEGGDRNQFMVSGDMVNVAARLQQGADADEVVVGDLTRRLTAEAIEYRPRPPIDAKGKRQPLPAHTALRARLALPGPVRGVEGLWAPLIGRTRELRLLGDTVARVVEERRAHVFTVVGGPGVGKSRLIAEAQISLLEPQGARVVGGRCLPYGRGITYWPFAEMVRQDCGIRLTDPGQDVHDKLAQRLDALFHDQAQAAAVLARLLVILNAESATSALGDISAERVSRELAWGFRVYLESVAASAPLAFVIDDLQWAEPPAVEALEQLADRVRDLPLLLLCVARPELLEGHPSWGAGKPSFTTITLEPLSADETSSLISALLTVEAIPTGLRQRIVERSGGTPLYCEEFLRMLIDDGVLAREDGKWKATRDLQDIALPPTVQALLAARLDGLDEDERSLLQVASVIGEHFMRSQVEAITAQDPSDLLDRAERKALIAENDREGPGGYRFRHLLIRDAAYASLPKERRAHRHEQFAHHLADTGDPRQLAQIILHHAERSLGLSRDLLLEGGALTRRAEFAMDWSVQVGRWAIEGRDTESLQVSLEAAEGAAAVLGDDPGVRARLLLLRGGHADIVGDYDASRHLLREAAQLAEAAGLPSIAAEAHIRRSWMEMFGGTIEHVYAAQDEALRLYHEAGDQNGELDAEFSLAMRLWSRGVVDEFLDTVSRLAERALEIGRPHVAADMMLWCVIASLESGSIEDVDARIQRGLELSRAHGLRMISAQLEMRAGRLLAYRGDIVPYMQSAERLLVLAREVGDSSVVVTTLRNVGEFLAEVERFREAEPYIAEALELSERTGDRWSRAELLAARAHIAAVAGEHDLADMKVAASLELAREGDDYAHFQGNLALGEVRALEKRHDEADVAFSRAMELGAPLGFRWQVTTAQLGYARFLAERGRTVEANALLDAAETWLRSANYTLWDGRIAAIRELIGGRID